jgi:hypothetical protein
MAEHALRLVTPGTHTWSKYVNADEMQSFFRDDLKWLPQHGAPWPFNLTLLAFFMLIRTVHRSTEQHYRDSGDILQPPHLEVGFTTSRPSWRIGSQLHLLDTEALYAPMSISIIVTIDLTILFETLLHIP